MITMNDSNYGNTIPSSMITADAEISETEDIEVDDSFFDDEIDVVRAEYASDSNEPTISFNKCQLYVNMVCIKKFPETDYVQFLINKTKRQLALLPCRGDERDAFLWRTINSKSGKRQPKYITAQIFSAMLFDYMGWDIHCRYRLIGKIKISRGIKLLVFELGSYRVFAKESAEGSDTERSQGYFPGDWKGWFGLPYKEHDRIMEIATFKNYATISITDNDSIVNEDTTGEKVTDYGNEIATSEN